MLVARQPNQGYAYLLSLGGEKKSDPHADRPVVVEAVGNREQIEAALPTIREVLGRGLITLTDVELYAPET